MGERDDVLDRICRKLDDVRDDQVEHGKCLARLDERTEQHGRRMDRMDRRAGGWGAFTGALTGLATAVAAFLGVGR